ncbi:MAG TPA: hypothetical protein PK472_15175, partial [Pseudomonadota bacterium]|nr:hypothetical protein [Pseudomonadota bacterium]
AGAVPPMQGNGSGSISAMRQGGLPGLPPPRSATIDEEHERWLITKEDRMDYGPFSLRDVKAQIERGSISAEHTITDTETNDKRRVADHPLLGQMAREWTAKHMELDRQMKEEAERAKYNRAVVKMLAGIFAAVVVAGSGVGVWLVTRPKPQVVKQTGPQFTDDPLKGLQIAMQPMPPAPPKKKKKAGPKNGAFDDSQSVDFNDGGDTLSAEDIQKTMMSNFSVLSGCLREEAARSPQTKKIDLEFIVKGTGSVSSVRVNGSTSTPVASCAFAKMQSIRFPECKTCQKTVAAFSLTLK